MANPFAGEVTVTVDGTPRVMKLTLGALAELESELGAETLVALIARLEAGEISARDVLNLIVAGLRGGGWPVTRADLLTAEIEGGPVVAAQAAGVLLARAFAPPA